MLTSSYSYYRSKVTLFKTNHACINQLPDCKPVFRRFEHMVGRCLALLKRNYNASRRLRESRLHISAAVMTQMASYRSITVRQALAIQLWILDF